MFSEPRQTGKGHLQANWYPLTPYSEWPSEKRGVETPRRYAKPVKNRLRGDALVRFERTSSYQPMISIIGYFPRKLLQ